MTAQMTWAHVGDPHAFRAEGFATIDRLEAITDKRHGFRDAIHLIYPLGTNPDSPDLLSMRRPQLALDRDGPSVGAWLEHGVMGIRLGPYRDGCAS